MMVVVVRRCSIYVCGMPASQCANGLHMREMQYVHDITETNLSSLLIDIPLYSSMCMCMYSCMCMCAQPRPASQRPRDRLAEIRPFSRPSSLAHKRCKLHYRSGLVS